MNLRRALLLLWLVLGTPSSASAESAPCEWTHITGSVRDDDGPLPYAKMAFVGEVWDSGCVTTRRSSVETRADSVGHYDLDVRAASGALLFFYHQNLDRYGGDKPVPLSLQPGEMVVDYTFHSARVRCLVTGPDGKPASGSFYFDGCEPGPGSFCGDVSPQEFKDGAFDAYAPNGLVNVHTSLNDLPGGPRWTRTYHVKSDTTVTMAYPGLMVRGDLRRHGAPLEAAIVTATGDGAVASARTDSLGKFVVCVPSGSYRWMIEPKGIEAGSWYEMTREVEASQPVRLDLGKAKRKR
jgi:hypothetical protein